MMNNIKTRKKLLEKIAQTTPVPTDQVANETIPASILPPPNFQASSAYPGIRKGFNAATVVLIDTLSNILNRSLHYATAGKVNFQTLRDDNFSLDISGMPSADQKNLLSLSKKLFQDFYNRGTPFAQFLTKEQVEQITNKLLSASELSNLATINPAGAIGQKVSSNLKTTITDILNNIKAVNV